MTKSRTLDDMYTNFEGNKPLSENEYEGFFVDIYGNKLKRFMSSVQRNKVYERMFFIAGQRGNGKSTILNVLKVKNRDFDRDYNIKHLQAKDVFDYKDITIIDILIVIGLYLIDNAAKDSRDSLKKDFRNDLEELAKINSGQIDKEEIITNEKDRGINTGANIGVKLPAIFSSLFSAEGKAGATYKSSKIIREEIKTIFKINPKELLNIINTIISKCRNNKEILLILDGLEKLANPESIEAVFTNDVELLRDLKCFKIITIPIYLKEKVNNTDIDVLDFTMELDENGNIKNKELFNKIVEKRIENKDLIDKDAIDLAIEKSAGNVRLLLEIIQKSALEAMDILEVGKIDADIIEDVCTRIGGSLSTTIQINKKFLNYIKENHTLKNGDEEVLMKMIRAGLVFAYCNGKTDYNINPTIIKSLE